MPMHPPATTCATSRSSPTSTTARPPWSTPCSGSPAPSRPTRPRRARSTSGSWTRWTSSARRASRSSRRTPRCSTVVDGRELTINIIDTPGHADFGGEVERGLSMVDGVAAAGRRQRGPAAADPVRAAQGAAGQSLPVVLVINKVDRPDARIAEVVDETYELFLDLDADEDQIEFPIVYCSAKAGRASLTRARRTASMPGRAGPRAAVPAPSSRRSRRRRTTRAAPLQAHVTNLDASPYLGRLALCRVHQGTITQGPDRRLVPHRRHRSSGSRSPSC